MANRVLLGIEAGVAKLKLSKPTFDVLTATGDQLEWDISESGIEQRGFIGRFQHYSHTTTISPAEFKPTSKTGVITFPKTFAFPPATFGCLKYPSFAADVRRTTFHTYHIFQANGNDDETSIGFTYEVTTTQLTYTFFGFRNQVGTGIVAWLGPGDYTFNALVAQS